MSIIRILIIAILVYAAYRLYKMLRQPADQRVGAKRPQDPQPIGEDLVQDPCCETYIPVSQAYTKEINGKKTHFCSQVCYQKFIERKP